MKDRRLDYFAHKFGLGLSTQRVTCYFRNRSYGHDFLRVQFFGTKFLHTRLSLGGVSLLENWILEGGEQGNFPVNAFVFLSIVSGLFFFLEQSYEKLCIQKFFSRKKNHHKLNLQEFKVWSKL